MKPKGAPARRRGPEGTEGTAGAEGGGGGRRGVQEGVVTHLLKKNHA